MPRIPISQSTGEITEGDGSFDSQLTEGARAMLESVDAYIAAHTFGAAKQKTSSEEAGQRDTPQMKLD